MWMCSSTPATDSRERKTTPLILPPAPSCTLGSGREGTGEDRPGVLAPTSDGDGGEWPDQAPFPLPPCCMWGFGSLSRQVLQKERSVLLFHSGFLFVFKHQQYFPVIILVFAVISSS